VPDNLGLADIDHFAQFIRGTKVPHETPSWRAGGCPSRPSVFERIGCICLSCQASRRRRRARGSNGGAFVVPAALGNKIIHPYAFLLHDIETGDGIVRPGRRIREPTPHGALWASH